MCYKSRPLWCGWTGRMMPVWALWCLIVQQNWSLTSVYAYTNNNQRFSSKIQTLQQRCSLWLFALHWMLWQQKCVGVTLTLRIFRLWQACLVMQFQKPIWWSHCDPSARCHLFVVCNRTRHRASSPIPRLKAPLCAQSLWCNESRMCALVIVLVRRGESRAFGVMDNVATIRHQRSPATRRATVVIVRRLCLVFVLA